MAVLRQANLLGQERVDVPMLRQIEASITGDFDMVGGRTLAANRPLVIRGFTINTSGVVGQAANALQLTTADGIVANVEATESGSLLWIPTDRAAETLNSTTNSNVVGSFTPSATNNIGIDFVRSANADTSDLAQFVDPSTELESPKIVPLARTLNYRIVITTQPFSAQPNLIPIATVVTTSQNNVSTIVDARNMFGRLAPGGDFPSTTTGWTFATPRLEGDGSDFSGPDKNFEGLKDWADAVMTRIWEVGGGEGWFSGTADRNVNFVFVGVPFTGGEYFTWDGTNLHWKGLRFVFDNSTGTYNDILDQTSDSAGLTDLADGECIYVDLKREIDATGGTALQAVKGELSSLGTGSPPGSRTILAWRVDTSVFYRGWRFPVGVGFAPATTTTNGVVTLFQTPGSALNPVVLNLDSNNSIAWAASGGNAHALTVTGNGTGSGLIAVGGGTGSGGDAIRATATVSGKTGVYGESLIAGVGVWGAGGTTGAGLYGVGGSTSGIGVVGVGGGLGLGGVFTGGATVNAHGLSGTGGAGGGYGGYFLGTTIYTGLRATGGPSTVAVSDGAGVHAVGGAGGGLGVYAEGGGTDGGGIHAIAVGTGVPVKAVPSATDKVAVKANGYIDMFDAATVTTATDKFITPTQILRSAARFTLTNAPGITLNAGFNIFAVAIDGSSNITVTLENAAIGTSLCIQVTDWNNTGTVVQKVVVTSVDSSGTGGRTRIQLKPYNTTTGAAIAAASVTGFYLTVWSFA